MNPAFVANRRAKPNITAERGKLIVAQDVKFRIERDTMGEVRVPEDAYYGAQTQRAVDNFPVSGL